MYYAEYDTYTTPKYTTIQEAVNDMVQYMIDNDITDEFKVYRTVHIDARDIIKHIQTNDILDIIKTYAIELYGDDAEGYLDTLDEEALKYFIFALEEYKKVLTSWLFNYKLEPMWERIAATFIYKYDIDNKVWQLMEEIV